MKKIIKGREIEIDLNSFNSISINKYYVYVLRCEINNDIRYIGKTLDLISTKNRHYNYILEYGLNFEVVAECYSNNIAEFIESKLIKELKSKCELLNKVIY